MFFLFGNPALLLMFRICVIHIFAFKQCFTHSHFPLRSNYTQCDINEVGGIYILQSRQDLVILWTQKLNPSKLLNIRKSLQFFFLFVFLITMFFAASEMNQPVLTIPSDEEFPPLHKWQIFHFLCYNIITDLKLFLLLLF